MDHTEDIFLQVRWALLVDKDFLRRAVLIRCPHQLQDEDEDGDDDGDDGSDVCWILSGISGKFFRKRFDCNNVEILLEWIAL